VPKNSMFHGTASLIRDLSLKIQADEKARSGLMLAGGISKLEAFCEKPLLPRSHLQRIERSLSLDCRQ